MDTQFLIIAILLVILALSFLLRPLLRGRQSLISVILLIIIVPAVSWLVYDIVGTPEALNPQQQVNNPENTPKTMAEAIKALKEELQSKPDNVEGWMLLGRSLMSMNNPAEAVSAYRKALKLEPENAYIKMELGDAILRASNPTSSEGFPAEAKAYLQAAYNSDPELQKAQWLLGIAAASEEDYQHALELWQDLLPKLKPGSNIATTVGKQINQAKTALGIEVTQVKIKVVLADSIAVPDDPQAVVFIFLKIPDQPGMPLAVKRLPAAQLPLEVTLTDTDILQAGKSLDDFPELLLSAKLSSTGSANKSANDLKAESLKIKPKDPAEITLTLKH